jgi:hypothetical protein
MMKGVTRSRVTSSPVSNPAAVEARMPPQAAVHGPAPARRSDATTTVASATPDPTERSMPPCTMIIVMPTATTATTTVWRAIVTRFAAPRKVSGLSAENSA